MRERLTIEKKAPQYVSITGLTFAQVDSWFGHCMMDLKLDIIYPEDKTKKYPCVVWICGGAWLRLDKSAHLAYLSQLARAGFVVASVEYRTSNEVQFPGQLQDVKAAIRYLKANGERFNIDINHFGVMGESAGGYLTLMCALAKDKKFDVGEHLDFSSEVQAAVPWYPPTDFASMQSAASNAGSPESLLLGMDVGTHLKEAQSICPISFVTKDAPPIMIIHGKQDKTVPFNQSELIYDKLESCGCDVNLLELDGADHADLRFFQEEIWERIIKFFQEKLAK